MFRVGDQDPGGDDAEEGFGREVADLSPLQCLQVRPRGVVLVVFGSDIVVD